MEKVGFPSHSGYLLEIYLEMIWFGDELPKNKAISPTSSLTVLYVLIHTESLLLIVLFIVYYF